MGASWPLVMQGTGTTTFGVSSDHRRPVVVVVVPLACQGGSRAGGSAPLCRGVSEHGAGFGLGCVVAEKSIKNKSSESAARAAAIAPESGRL